MCNVISVLCRDFHSLQINMKQQGRKKLIIYSIYAWSFPFIFVVICGILDVVSVPEMFKPYFIESYFFGKINKDTCH